MNAFFTIIACGAYIASAVLLLKRLRQGVDIAEYNKTPALVSGLFGALLHGVLLHQSIYIPDGLNLSFFNMLSIMGWVIALLLLITAWKKPVENLGIAALPFSALTLVAQEVFKVSHVNLTQVSAGMEAHILLSILSYSLLSLAVVQALLLALQDHHLRHRQPGGFIRALPPLETMESLLFQMIGLGYVLLTLSLLTGVTFIEDIFAQHLVHKTALSFLSWAVFAILLWGRWQFGWRGRIAIRWTLSGFVFLMLAYFGSKLVLELILSR